MDFDVVVIGGGVVGLSAANFLSKDYSVLLVEKHPSFGCETSSRNSEVIHSGIYYPKHTLKAKLCREGNKSLYEWCERNNVPFKRIGKLIVAAETKELPLLAKLLENAKDNGIDNISMLTGEEVSKMEPNVKSIAGLWVESTGIVDSHRLMESIFASAQSNGCSFAFRHCVDAIRFCGDCYELTVSTDTGDVFSFSSKFVVNSAGLYSDLVCSLLGLDIDALGYRLLWAKGHYFRVHPSKQHLVNHLIYPVPPIDSPFLGIHLTIELSGGLKLGPDIVFLDKRILDYTVREELREIFYQSVSRYLTGLTPSDLMPDQAGIRPKLKYYREYPDFIIKEESKNGFPGFINLVGIESPGLTCCLEIGKFVANLVNNIS